MSPVRRKVQTKLWGDGCNEVESRIMERWKHRFEVTKAWA